MDHFDLIVIGSGPAGQKAATAAAKLGRTAAVIERRNMVGGVCIITGTIPAKALREAVLYRTGLSQRELYGQAYRVKDDITVSDLSARTQHVINREIDVIRNQLSRNRVALISGTARFLDARTVEVENEQGHQQNLTADKFVIAVGTRPARPKSIEFDGQTVVDSDQILNMKRVPRRWWWSAPASSASSTRRCSRHWGRRSPSSRSGPACSSSATRRSSRRSSTSCATWR